ncbi:NUDIX hydrolase [Herbiconiux sp. CPCC 203407]|uniref:NUDIX hydrolase n=1 Tax=Herbiconiux oxytropis TaxID=2970915 RepID=A0AA42BUP7_9MICO|nr:NUDIX hydrolase [Herbiconiux oxytropis]MCS5723492.1 NUDIX hydrolase [Herbiconiux oxytropis]MCS5726411.1 NUDIX hydrolase [Herbiconiux oxytropis]
MTVVPPRLPPRDSGDAWVEGPDGRRFWGRYGAAGLLVHDPEAGILLQHRAEWSHFGGTWGLPGGARHEGESAIDGALREAGEEAGVPADALGLAFTSTLDLGYWSYVTVVTRALRAFTPRIGDAESLELRWVPVDEVEALPLHPGFGSAWPVLRERLAERVRIVVDAANVVGSRPDGWWKDRVGAAERLLAGVTALAAAGVEARALEGSAPVDAPSSAPVPREAPPEGPGTRAWPAIRVVLEGQAKGAQAASPLQPGESLLLPAVAVEISSAPSQGDDTIVAEATAGVAEGFRVLVVTADRELRSRVEREGAEVRGPSWLLSLTDAAVELPAQDVRGDD